MAIRRLLLSLRLRRTACAAGAAPVAPVRLARRDRGLHVHLVEGAVRLLGLAEHAGVQAAGGHQLVVLAALRDAAVIEHHDLVGQRDGGRPVGDDERGAVVGDLLQGAADLELRLHVDAGGGVVQDEDARVHHEGARDGDALPLAAAEREAAFADDRVVALGEGLDELIGLGGLRGLAHLVVGGLRTAQADVLGDRLAEQERVLVDDADVTAQVGEAQVAHVLAVHEHATPR